MERKGSNRQSVSPKYQPRGKNSKKLKKKSRKTQSVMTHLSSSIRFLKSDLNVAQRERGPHLGLLYPPSFTMSITACMAVVGVRLTSSRCFIRRLVRGGLSSSFTNPTTSNAAPPLPDKVRPLPIISMGLLLGGGPTPSPSRLDAWDGGEGG